MTEHSKEVMERRRQGFENWYSQSWDGDDQLQSVSVFMRDERGQYICGHVHESFKVWCAALDSVVIELPRESQVDGLMFISVARQAIESTDLGLRFK